MVAAQNICWAIYEWTEDNSLKWFHCVLDWKVALKRICLLPSPWNLWILPYEVEKWILQYITKDVTQMWEWDHKEGWASKHQYFQIVALEKTPESPLIARRSNQLILQEINTEYSLEGLIRKLQYFGHLMWRADSLEKPLMLGKIEGRRRRGQQRMRLLDGITDLHEFEQLGSWWWTGKPGMFQSIGSQRVLHDWLAELTWRLQQYSLSFKGVGHIQLQGVSV